jgi:Tat protein secretion system quality control protein TatD with DNase activity
MARQIPHERLLLESDSPDQKPNWSLHELRRIVNTSIGIDLEEFEKGKEIKVTTRLGGVNKRREESVTRDKISDAENGRGTEVLEDGKKESGSDRQGDDRQGDDRQGGGGRGRRVNCGKRVNEPLAVIYACYALAEALDLCPQSLADITSENAQRVFWFPPSQSPTVLSLPTSLADS